MKANELRIGNYILFAEEGIEFVVDAIDKTGFSVHNEREDTWIESNLFEGIPLTEEWLLKFGFEKINHRTEGIIYQKEWLRLGEIMFCDWRGGRIGKVETVHRLQNLYFALTGEELTLNN